jgi:hypothetical protein
LRSYTPAVEAKAKEWRDRSIDQVAVRRHGYFTPSNDGACPVILPCGLESFLKPRDHNNLTVAREKIASDLGYDLQLPVAPTLVREACNEFPHPCVLSLVSLPQPRPWHSGSDDLRQLGVEALESLRAFWIWIGETDHEGNFSNLLYERHGDTLKIVSIDHARSLGFGFQGNVFAHSASIGYGTARLEGAKMARDALVGRVEELPEDRLQEVVGRLRPILTQGEQGEILDLLRRRRDKLREWLNGEGDQ